jgi:hypothetical protein
LTASDADSTLAAMSLVIIKVAVAAAFLAGAGSATAQVALVSPKSAAIERRLREEEQGYDIGGRRFVIGQDLAEGRKARHTFPVERGKSYFALALCDDACGDIDLVVRDTAGNVLDNDEANGADPVLLFRAEATGSVEVVVSMKACDEDACEYGLGFHTLRRNASRD